MASLAPAQAEVEAWVVAKADQKPYQNKQSKFDNFCLMSVFIF